MIDCRRIAEALADYDPNANQAAVLKAEEQRSQLVDRFSKEGWSTMTLDQYALGQPDHQENFCRWMEFVTSDFSSIRGGSARKHLIYFQAKAGEWWFDHKLFESVEQAWEAVRQGFVDAIGLAEAGEWSQIEQIRESSRRSGAPEQDARELLPRRTASDQL